ncbi:unnamed protein product [Closterium sp. NIES-53]
MEGRKAFRNNWQIEMWQAPAKELPFCCIATWCSPCASYYLRDRVLYGDMSRYQCCGGFLPCSGHCGESKCPKFCLGVEVCLCFPSSVASTRFLIQDQLNIMNSKCDNGILAFLVCLEQLACIFAILACILQDEVCVVLADNPAVLPPSSLLYSTLPRSLHLHLPLPPYVRLTSAPTASTCARRGKAFSSDLAFSLSLLRQPPHSHPHPYPHPHSHPHSRPHSRPLPHSHFQCCCCCCHRPYPHKIELDTRDSHNAANAPPTSAPPQQTMQS